MITTLKNIMVLYWKYSTLKCDVLCSKYSSTKLSVSRRCICVAELFLKVFTEPAISSSQEATAYFLSLSSKLDAIANSYVQDKSILSETASRYITKDKEEDYDN